MSSSNWSSSMFSLGKDIRDRISTGLQELENQAAAPPRSQRNSGTERLGYQPRQPARPVSPGTLSVKGGQPGHTAATKAADDQIEIKVGDETARNPVQASTGSRQNDIGVLQPVQDGPLSQARSSEKEPSRTVVAAQDAFNRYSEAVSSQAENSVASSLDVLRTNDPLHAREITKPLAEPMAPSNDDDVSRQGNSTDLKAGTSSSVPLRAQPDIILRDGADQASVEETAKDDLDSLLNRHESEYKALVIQNADLSTQQDLTLREKARLERLLTETEHKANNLSISLASTIQSHNERYAAMQKDLDSAREVAKDEEEKRLKSFSLLKALRQKTLKMEKEKEDLLSDREKAWSEIKQLRTELTESQAKATEAMSESQERFKRDLAAAKAQAGLEVTALRLTMRQDAEGREQRIALLESQLKSEQHSRSQLFDQVQTQQAQVELYKRQTEAMESDHSELAFRSTELSARVSLLEEENGTLVEQVSLAAQSLSAKESIEDLLAGQEARHAERLQNLLDLQAQEKDLWQRSDASSKQDIIALNEHIGQVQTENHDLNAQLKIASETVKAKDADIERLNERQDVLEGRLQAALSQLEKLGQGQRDLKETVSAQSSQQMLVEELQEEIRQLNSRLSSTQAQNKTLRDEVKRHTRKGSGSANMLSPVHVNGPGSPSEKDASLANGSDSRNPPISLEYLRNVVLQFLEHKEMRGQLTQVLSMLLQFSPAETRRLQAKLNQ